MRRSKASGVVGGGSPRGDDRAPAPWLAAAQGYPVGDVRPPITTFESMYGRRQTTTISVKMRSATEVTAAMRRAEEAMRLAHRLRPSQPSDFSILYQDTEAAPFDAGSSGSQTTMNNGRAVVAAAGEVRDLLRRAMESGMEIGLLRKVDPQRAQRLVEQIARRR